MDFEAVYARWFKPVYAYIRCRIWAENEAADVAAGVWQKVWEKRGQYNPARGRVEQWLFGIASHEVSSYCRRAYLRRILSLSGFEENVPSAVSNDLGRMEIQEKTAALLAAVHGLSRQEKELIALKFYSGMNNREIAALVGKSESNVGTILHRAFVRLRLELGKFHE